MKTSFLLSSFLKASLSLFVVILFAADLEAQRYRRRMPARRPVNTQPAPAKTPAPAPAPAEKQAPEVAPEAPALKNAPAADTVVIADPEERRQAAALEYVLGADFASIVKTFPQEQKLGMLSLASLAETKLREDMQKQFPAMREEVRQPLTGLAMKIYFDGAQPKDVTAAVKEISALKLTSQEVLAVNQVVGLCIDAEEANAIAGLNNFRMRSGLRPCLIDLLLCGASRGHSSDMRRMGFFSHNSPVRGKGSFTSRAAQHGASASAENIYMGSSRGSAANSAWINSSGHRANMLGGHSRVGVGRAGGHFTQMFGR